MLCLNVSTELFADEPSILDLPGNLPRSCNTRRRIQGFRTPTTVVMFCAAPSLFVKVFDVINDNCGRPLKRPSRNDLHPQAAVGVPMRRNQRK